MQTLHTEIVVIGAGTAGLSAFRAARKHTENALLIEAGPYGTTCARVGCMPSKLLIAAAEMAHRSHFAEEFGITGLSAPKVDGQRVMDRVKRERDRFVGFVLESVEEIPAKHRIKGCARFVGEKTLQVDDSLQIHAERFVIATGSTPVWPASFNELGDRLITNDQVFYWDTLPESVAVFGPGVIGLELGQALHRLGVKVRLFGRGGSLGPLTDPVVKASAVDIFTSEFAVDTNAAIESMSLCENGVQIAFKNNQGEVVKEQFEYVLAATGRKPNVDSLSLELTGIEVNDRGVPLFDPYTMQCGDSAIFIAGDANNDRPLLHEAADEGRIAGDNAGRYPDIRAGARTTPLGIVFSDPNIAMIGATYAELEKREVNFEVGQVDFAEQGRSRVMLVNEGILRVYGEHGTGRLLGAEMVGPRTEHIAQQLAWCVQQDLTVGQILQMPFYHPVIEEGLRTALRALGSKLHVAPLPVKRCMDCGPGA